MTQPPDLTAPVLQAFGRFVDEPTPLEPETFLSQLLGMIWSGVEGERDEGVAYFCLMLADQLRAYGAKARPALELLATQAPADVAGRIAEQAAQTLGEIPAWVPMLRTVRFLGAFSSTDYFGQQENFVLHFDYGPDAGGNHVIIALVDRPLGILKDAFLVGPGGDFEQVLAFFRDQDTTIVDETVTAGYIASQIFPAMRGTSQLPDLDVLGEETLEAWHLLSSRMRACFTEKPAKLNGRERQKLVTRFLNRKATKNVAERAALDRGAMRVYVRAIVDFENDISGEWNDDDLKQSLGPWLQQRGLDDAPAMPLLSEWRSWRATL